MKDNIKTIDRLEKELKELMEKRETTLDYKLSGTIDSEIKKLHKRINDLSGEKIYR